MCFGMLVNALHLQNMIIDRIIYIIIFGTNCKLKVYIIYMTEKERKHFYNIFRR